MDVIERRSLRHDYVIGAYVILHYSIENTLHYSCISYALHENSCTCLVYPLVQNMETIIL